MKKTGFVLTSFLLLSLSAFSQYRSGEGGGSFRARQGKNEVLSVRDTGGDNTVLSRAMQTSVQTYPSQNISLLAHWDSTQVHTIHEQTWNGKDTTYSVTTSYSNVWGWANPKDKKEYAIVGSSDGTYFIDVTVPTAPVVCDLDTAHNYVIEIKTYQNYAYLMNTTGWKWNLRIFDLKYLPDSVHLVYADTVVPSSHTIFIDGDKLYCASTNRLEHGPMEVFSLANPEAPKLLRKLKDDDTQLLLKGQYAHDMFVRNDTVYASVPDLGILIYKFASNKFSRIGELTKYDEQGYNHSSALTADGKTLIFCDEIPFGLSVKSLDVSDFNNLTVRNYFKDTVTTLATPHNPYIRKGDNSRVVIAYYRDGVQIFNISNPSDVIRTGYFDTSPIDTSTPTFPSFMRQLAGCFGAYIDLPSGIILACDMQNGLFILDATKAMTNTTGIGTPPSNNIVNSINVYPNPANETLTIKTNTNGNQNLQVFDVSGRLVLNKIINGKATVDVRLLSKGIYNMRLTSSEGVVNKKLVIVR